jgi:hypothetical protein
MSSHYLTVVAVLTLFVFVSCAGCNEDDTVLAGKRSRQPEVSVIPDQNATKGLPFSLDLAACVFDDRDDVTDLTLL